MSKYNCSSARLEVALHIGSFLCRFLDESGLKWLEIFGNVDEVYWKINFCFSRQTSAFNSWTVAEILEIIAT